VAGIFEVPKPILAWTPWFMLGAGISAALAFIYYLIRRIKITINAGDKEPMIKVFDPSYPDPLIAISPFKVLRQYAQHRPYQSEESIRTFCITICNSKDTPFVTFMGGIGKWNETPPGFAELSHIGHFIKAPLIYETRAIVKISDLLPKQK